MKSRLFLLLIPLLIPFFINACGLESSEQNLLESAIPINPPELTEATIESNFIPDLNLYGTEGFIVAKTETWFKALNRQSSELSEKQKCIVEPRVNLKFSTLGPLVDGHRLITLEQSLQNCAFKTGYVFDNHVKYLSVKTFYAEPLEQTLLKKKQADSSTLTPSEWCILPAGRKFALSEQARDTGNGHAFITLKKNELASCGFSSGFVFVEHFNQLLEGTNNSDFAKVLKHILIWEGGCSDHPNDPGGRTYKGITTGRARQNNWTKDVCDMPDSLIIAIYRKDYWNNRAIRYAWPLNLAIMNTEVNSGGGKAQQFLNRMIDFEIQGSLANQATWYLDQQTDFYRIIADNNPSLRVFLRGWLNRSDYMQKVIDGRVSLFENKIIKFPTAKAMDK